MSTAQSMRAKGRWTDCGLAAEILGCGKTHVHDKLFSRMKEEGLLERVLSSEPAAVEEVRSWPEFNEVERPQLYAPKCDDAGAAIKLTLWYIDKIGGIDKAEKAIGVVRGMAEALK